MASACLSVCCSQSEFWILASEYRVQAPRVVQSLSCQFDNVVQGSAITTLGLGFGFNCLAFTERAAESFPSETD